MFSFCFYVYLCVELTLIIDFFLMSSGSARSDSEEKRLRREDNGAQSGRGRAEETRGGREPSATVEQTAAWTSSKQPRAVQKSTSMTCLYLKSFCLAFSKLHIAIACIKAKEYHKAVVLKANPSRAAGSNSNNNDEEETGQRSAKANAGRGGGLKKSNNATGLSGKKTPGKSGNPKAQPQPAPTLENQNSTMIRFKDPITNDIKKVYLSDKQIEDLSIRHEADKSKVSKIVQSNGNANANGNGNNKNLKVQDEIVRRPVDFSNHQSNWNESGNGNENGNGRLKSTELSVPIITTTRPLPTDENALQADLSWLFANNKTASQNGAAGATVRKSPLLPVIGNDSDERFAGASRQSQQLHLPADANNHNNNNNDREFERMLSRHNQEKLVVKEIKDNVK